MYPKTIPKYLFYCLDFQLREFWSPDSLPLPSSYFSSILVQRSNVAVLELSWSVALVCRPRSILGTCGEFCLQEKINNGLLRVAIG